MCTATHMSIPVVFWQQQLRLQSAETIEQLTIPAVHTVVDEQQYRNHHHQLWMLFLYLLWTTVLAVCQRPRLLAVQMQQTHRCNVHHYQYTFLFSLQSLLWHCCKIPYATSSLSHWCSPTEQLTMLSLVLLNVTSIVQQEAQLLLWQPTALRTTYGIATDRCVQYTWSARVFTDLQCQTEVCLCFMSRSYCFGV